MEALTGPADDFARSRLPPRADWPDLLLDGYDYPEDLNAAVELTDRMVERGFGARVALIGAGRRRTYQELADWTNQLARALIEDCGVRPGNRVLIRSANTPALVACWLAATKAGAVVVNTMPMLRSGELTKIVDKAEIALALCDARLTEELLACAATSGYLNRIVTFDGGAGAEGELDRLALAKSPAPAAVPTRSDDVALLAFTSGSTGAPKATMHFHRDLLIIADAYAKAALDVRPDDIFVGSPPLAFTFGLGGLAIFPLRFGAAAALFESATPAHLLDLIPACGATICFTAPTAYRAMLERLDDPARLASLRLCVASGESLAAEVFEAWERRTGKPILEAMGSTEMLHAFIGARLNDRAAGAVGRPIPGYQVRIVDDAFNDVARGAPGRLAVRGPTGCRYLDDARQRDYVQQGWNVTGDTFLQDEDGRFRFVARNDDMIVSAGYNIAAPEVEAALAAHPAVAECAVVGWPDAARGRIVAAFVVPKAAPDEGLALALQNHVKSVIAPYKYPRRIEFVAALPKTPSGKLQRFALRPRDQSPK
jgi:2-aminobenzoate-CoA ligase